MKTCCLTGRIVKTGPSCVYLMLLLLLLAMSVVGQVGAMQVGVLLEGALSIEILLTSLFVFVYGKAGLKDDHGQQCGHATNAGQPAQAWLGQEG